MKRDYVGMGIISFAIVFIIVAVIATIINQQQCLEKTCKNGEPFITSNGRCICAEIPK